LSVTFFVLLSSLSVHHWQRQPKRFARYGLGLAAYGAALLCKETALLLPIWLGAMQLKTYLSASGTKPRWNRFIAAQSGFILVGVGYLVVRLMKADVTGSSGPYTISLSPASLWKNIQAYTLDLYGLQAVGIVSANGLVGLTLLGIAAIWIVFRTQRWRIFAGGLWSACFLAPILVVQDRHYSYYFSLATVGVAMAASAVVDSLGAVRANVDTRVKRSFAPVLIVLVLIAWASYAGYRVNGAYNEQNLKAKGEQARQLIADLQQRNPDISQCSTIFVSGATEDPGGLNNMLMFFYPRLQQVTFAGPNASTAEAPVQLASCTYALPQ
jgi:hypothetical protein